MAKNLSVTPYEVFDLRVLIQEELARVNVIMEAWKGFDDPPAQPKDYSYLTNRKRRLKKMQAKLIKLA